MRYNIGDTICIEALVTISDIESIIPARYDGIKNRYVVSTPEKSQMFIISTKNGEYIAITHDCKNKDILIDLI